MSETETVFIITNKDVKNGQHERIMRWLKESGYRVLNDNRCLDFTNLRCADKVLVMPEFKNDAMLYKLFIEACKLGKTLISKVNITKYRIK